jgi:hypothetical protein
MISQTVVKCVEIRDKVYHELLHITLGAPNRQKAMLTHTNTATIDG